MTQPTEMDSEQWEAADPERPDELTDPPTDTQPAAVDPVQLFRDIREALRGPASDDRDRDQKLWVIPRTLRGGTDVPTIHAL